MKNILVLATSLLALSAHAESPRNQSPADYKFFSASFGTDGASNEPYPSVDSTIDAKALYEAMKPLDSKGEKFIGLTVDKQRYGLICEEPKKGITTETAGCEFTGFSKKKGFHETDLGVYIGDVKFGGKLAKMLVAKMVLEKDATRVGSITYKLANLTCTEVVGRDVFECTFSHAVVKSLDLDELVKHGVATEAQAKKLIKTFGY